MDATLPTDKVPYGNFGGYLVGSAEQSFDILAADSGMELVSYGIRRIPGNSWVYGTGVALPRLQQAIDL